MLPHVTPKRSPFECAHTRAIMSQDEWIPECQAAQGSKWYVDPASATTTSSHCSIIGQSNCSQAEEASPASSHRRYEWPTAYTSMEFMHYWQHEGHTMQGSVQAFGHSNTVEHQWPASLAVLGNHPLNSMINRVELRPGCVQLHKDANTSDGAAMPQFWAPPTVPQGARKVLSVDTPTPSMKLDACSDHSEGITGGKYKPMQPAQENMSSNGRRRITGSVPEINRREADAGAGKDRHSKVKTAKGLRDRRVSLSMSTALQIYDIQDRLGFKRPSQVCEWLIAHAKPAIDLLPPAAAVVDLCTNNNEYSS